MRKQKNDPMPALLPFHQKWLQEFLQNLQRAEKSPLTLQSYRSDLIHFLSWFEVSKGCTIARANASHIADYQNFLKTGQFRRESRPFIMALILNLFLWQKAYRWSLKKESNLPCGRILSPSSRKRRLSVLKKFFDYLSEIHRARNQKLFQNHPVSRTLHHIKLKDVDIQHTKLLPAKDYSLVEAALIYPEDRLLAGLLFYGGLRIREAASLKFTDFNADNQTLSFIRKGGKRHLHRPLEFQRLYRELERVKARQIVASEYVFASHDGKRALSVRALHSRIKKYLARAGLSLDLTPHSFRKGCATHLYQKTRDLLHVRDYLNHQNALVTQTYIETPPGP